MKVFSGGEQISGVDARKLVFGYNTDWSASACNFVDLSPFAQLIEQEIPAPPTKIGGESCGNWKYPFPIPKNHASQSNTSLPPHYQMHEVHEVQRHIHVRVFTMFVFSRRTRVVILLSLSLFTPLPDKILCTDTACSAKGRSVAMENRKTTPAHELDFYAVQRYSFAV